MAAILKEGIPMWRGGLSSSCRVAGRRLAYRLVVYHMWRGHQHQRKSKFHLWPLWKIIKLGFVCSPSLVQQKCQLLTPHKFRSRVPSLLTIIKITRSAIMKNDKIGFCAFPVARTAKVSITDPPQVWVKGSIVVNRNRNFPLGHFEKWQNWVLCVPRRSYSKSVNYRPPISLGQRFHRCWRKSKFPARPLWKMTKLGFVRSRCSYSKSVNYRPPISLVKGSIVVDGNRNFPLGHYEKWQNWVLCVPRRLYSKSVNYWPPTSLGQGFHRY